MKQQPDCFAQRPSLPLSTTGGGQHSGGSQNTLINTCSGLATGSASQSKATVMRRPSVLFKKKVETAKERQ